jgi:predicted nucleic-acid-binding protein
MISLDTNILVRLLTNDEPKQAEKARKALDLALRENQRIWVSTIVMCELVWVLRSLYAYDKTQTTLAVNALLAFSGLELQNAALIKKALVLYATHTSDFADILLGLIGEREGADYTLTFDKKAAKLASHKLLI